MSQKDLARYVSSLSIHFVLIKIALIYVKLFELLVTRFPRAPELVVYDNSCNLAAFCYNNEPQFFQNTRFAIDSFHYVNHKNCNTAFNSIHISERNSKLQFSLSEQKNLRFALLRPAFSKMHPRNSLPLLIYMRSRLNRYEWSHLITYGQKGTPLQSVKTRFKLNQELIRSEDDVEDEDDELDSVDQSLEDFDQIWEHRMEHDQTSN